MTRNENDEPLITHVADATVTSGIGTGADASTPSGAEHTLAVDDITALVSKVNSILAALETLELIKRS